MDNIAGVLATRLGRTRAFGPANPLVLAFQAPAGAYKCVATTSNGVPSCDIGDGIIQQRRRTMNYTKPEVAVLGEAVRVIEMIGKGSGSSDSPLQGKVNPAYDLDE